MTEVTPIQSKNNTQLYATAAAVGAGAAVGGTMGYLSKPFLQKNGELSDKFIKAASEKLPDNVKQAIDTKMKESLDELDEAFKGLDLSDTGVIAATRSDLAEELEVASKLKNYYSEVANAGTIDDVKQIAERYGEAFTELDGNIDSFREAAKSALEIATPDIEKKQALLDAIKKTDNLDEIKSILTEANRSALIEENMLNLTKEQRESTIIKQYAEELFSGSNKERILKAKNIEELRKLSAEILPEESVKNAFSELFDSSKGVFKEGDTPIGKEVSAVLSDTASKMKTRAALIYGAIGAAALGLIGYFATKNAGSSKAKIDTKA